MSGSVIIPLGELDLLPQEVYDAMGYRGSEPDLLTQQCVQRLIASLDDRVMPSYAIKFFSGSVQGDSVTIDEVVCQTGPTITKILQGAERFAVFIATAGEGYEQWANELRSEGNIITEFIADAIGSALVIRVGKYMDQRLQEQIGGANHTNHFSPGQCKWNLSEQTKLFELLGDDHCGVMLSGHYLMHPVKSISGIVAIGEGVTPSVNSCSLCSRIDCFRRDTNSSH